MLFDVVRTGPCMSSANLEESLTVHANYTDEGPEHDLAFSVKHTSLCDSSGPETTKYYMSYDELCEYLDTYTRIIAKKSENYVWTIRIDGFPSYTVPIKRVLKESVQDDIMAMIQVFTNGSFFAERIKHQFFHE